VSKLKPAKISQWAHQRIIESGDHYEPLHSKLDRLLQANQVAPKRGVAKKPADENLAKIKEAFLLAYSKKFKQDYLGWGPKEYGQTRNWLKSVPLERAIELCVLYPNWTDPFVTKSGHPFSLLVTQHVKLWTDYTRARSKVEGVAQYKDAQEEIKTRVAVSRIGNEYRAEGLPFSSNLQKEGAPISLESE